MHLKLLFICLFCLMFKLVFSQCPLMETKEDAWTILATIKADSCRQLSYNFLGNHYSTTAFYEHTGFDSAFYYLRKAVYVGDSSNKRNADLTNESLILLSKIYLYSGDFYTSQKITKQVAASYQLKGELFKEAFLWREKGKALAQMNSSEIEILRSFDSAAFLYAKNGNGMDQAEALFDKMNYLHSISKDSASDLELRKLLNMAKANDAALFVSIYCVLAREHRYRGNLNMALEYALEATKYINRKNGERHDARLFGELAQIYESLGDPANSVQWYQRCIQAREKLNFSTYIIYRTTALMILQMIKIKKAHEALTLLRQLAHRRAVITQAEKAVYAQCFAYCYAALQQNDLAEREFLKMVSWYEKYEINSDVLVIAYTDIIRFYVDVQQYKKADIYLNKVLPYKKIFVGFHRDLVLLKSKVDSANGNLSSALQYFQKYKLLDDSIFNEAKSKQINELMIKYESEKKDNNISSLEKDRDLQRILLSKEKQTRNWIGGVSVLLLIITGLLIYNPRLKQQTNRRLRTQQKEIQSQNLSLHHLVEEKDWLVREIHHRVKNNFHTVVGLLGTHAAYLQNDEAVAAIVESQQRIQAMSLIHQKLYQTEGMSSVEISGYIHELVDYLKFSFDVKNRIQFKLQLEQMELSLDQAIPIGLILNEAITNAIKYAFPQNTNGAITILLTAAEENDEHILLEVIDDGIGLPTAINLDDGRTMGMHLMKGLAKDIDAEFNVTSSSGTKISVSFKRNRETIVKDRLEIEKTQPTV